MNPRTGRWADDKVDRIRSFWRYRWRYRNERCGACNGSGRYDNDGSPDCGSCEGTGVERVRAPEDSAAAIVALTAALAPWGLE
jgi:hypothetical protein